MAETIHSNRRRDGAIVPLTSGQRLSAVGELAAAIAALTPQQGIHGTTEYGTDLGEVLSNIAMALDTLGIAAEATSGGFGRPATLTLLSTETDHAHASQH